ncbi:hypothetical protein LGIHADK_02292 [Mannheimia haemolytica]
MCIYQRKTMKKLLAALLAILMTSCSNTVTSVTTTGCTAFSLIYPNRADTLETKRQILAHNLTFEEICQNEIH